MGKLSTNLFNGWDHQLRGAIVVFLGESDMRRLVIVSNRVADPGRGQASGGLAVGILDALRTHGGMWFGWNGNIVADEAEIATASVKHDSCTLVTMPLTERDYREYYLGFSNEVLWPVHHYRLDLARLTLEAAEGYRRVNARFAEKLSPIVNRSDLIWVHDYHLIPLGAGLRRAASAMKSASSFIFHFPRRRFCLRRLNTNG